MIDALLALKATIIIPASNEAGFISDCLEAVLVSETDLPFETIVVANGCRDATAEISREVGHRLGSDARPLKVIETEIGGKLRALQVGDENAQADIRIYLDADVLVTPRLIGKLIDTLSVPVARYASGQPRIPRARSLISRIYARFWQKLPFVTQGVPGFGIFAMNKLGRERWGNWPDIISDDTFARLQFSPEERFKVAGEYDWPIIEGFAGLVRVRRRQNQGVTEIETRFPDLIANQDHAGDDRSRKLKAAIRDPVGCLVYLLVAIGTRLPSLSKKQIWARGR